MNSNLSIPPHLYFIASAIFHYLGPSFAVLLFPVVSVEGVAWLRIASAAVVFLLIARPVTAFLRSTSRSKMLIVLFGLTFGLMNYSFYYAIDRLPLSTVAAIEFIGPVLLCLFGTKTMRNLLALCLAFLGVYLLTEFNIDQESSGLIWAFINALLFMLYIILAHQLASSEAETSPINRLGASMIFALLVISPLGIQGAQPAFTNIGWLSAGVGVGITSSVIPYLLDQLAMVRMSRSTYALFIAILPAAATIIGAIVLAQIPNTKEISGIVLVISGVLLAKDHSLSKK